MYIYMNIGVQISVRILVFNSSEHILRSRIAGLHDNFLRNRHNVFHSWLHHFTLPPRIHNHSNLSRPLTTHVIFWFFDNSHPSGYEGRCPCGFDLHFPNDHYVDYFSMCLLAIYTSSWEKYLFMSFAHFLFEFLLLLLLLSWRSSLCILVINPLSDT